MRNLFFLICGLLLSSQILKSQEAPNPNTTIFWDTSVSMKDRNLEKDLEVLDKVFQRSPDQEVQLLLFNIGIEEKTYQIRGGNWGSLRSDLEAVQYDGATYYALLSNLARHPNIYLFTDGNRGLDKDTPDLPAKSFLINSSPNRDEEFLKRTALINRYRLMDFAAILPENIASLKKPVGSKKKLVKGKVYIDNVPVPDVVVAVKGMPGGTRSVVDGSFSIEAQPGDSLLLSSRSRNTYKVVAVEDTEQMNVFLEGYVFTLDEVTLVERRQEEVEAEVVTAYGKENKEKIGYAAQSIGDESITPIQTDVSQAVLNKFSNVTLRNDEDLGRATMRSNTSILGNNYGLVVIDGVPQRQSDSSRDGVQQFAERQNSQTSFDYVNPDNIASITVLKGYAATNKYGSLGANGVILITTKTAMASKQTGEPADLARLTDNIYDEEKSTEMRRSTIRKSLEESKSAEEAYRTYLEMRPSAEDNMQFFFDAADYFKPRDSQLAAVITSSILELFPKDIKTLRAVSLFLSEAGKNEQVAAINKEIIDIDEKNVQAWLDLAVAQRNIGEYQKSLQQLLALQGNSAPSALSVKSVSKTVNRELKNLIFRHSGDLITTEVPSNYLNNIKYNVRLVFEWNDPEAEFNLQFVNPQKRYFNWEHNSTSTSDRMKDEILNRYSSEEFEFYGEGVQGEWILNATYLNHIDLTNQVPLVLKCTLYQNFGYPNQTSEVIVLSFNTPGETKLLKTLQVN
ncbi:MAG: TonB-dependent receptor plug domain-containing protein [Flavobacteriaceae bacterium]|nr:TonB-dependent receptor plug domain-containing protein [Muriicola sp.]NNL39963.1 TonB-dependent receptor plug domain-containing protein [Flavobacteriaceae bacterium]